MNIDSIKEIMDGFDPAALLPDLSSVFGKIELLCRIAVVIGPIILLIMGLSYLFFAPKEANHYFGYKCYFGMGSVQAWRFTQRFAGIVLGVVGLILTVVMFVLSTGFHTMEVPDMVWRSVVCLFWEAILAALALESINLTAMLLFDRKGVLRKQKKEGTAEPAAPAQKPAAPVQQPAEQQPVYEQPAYQEPVYEAPAYEEPAYDQSVYEEPVYDRSAYEAAPEDSYEEACEEAYDDTIPQPEDDRYPN